MAVRQPRVRDREAGADPARIRFTPTILPPYARRSKSLDTLIPILYLKGLSTGDFAPALATLLGKDAPGLSATTMARLKEVWTDEHKRWSERDLSAKSYVYVWADGVYLQARLGGKEGDGPHSQHARRCGDRSSAKGARGDLGTQVEELWHKEPQRKLRVTSPLGLLAVNANRKPRTGGDMIAFAAERTLYSNWKTMF